MNSRQYEKMMTDAYLHALAEANITEYVPGCLSADRTEYEVRFKDGTTRIIPSGFEKLDV